MTPEEHEDQARAALDAAGDILSRARAENRAQTADEEREYEDLVAFCERSKKLARAARGFTVEGGTERAFGTVNVNTRTSEPFANLAELARSRPGSTATRDRALTAFEDKRVTRGMTHDQQEALVERIETVPGAAEYALAPRRHGVHGGIQALGRYWWPRCPLFQ